MKIVVGYDGSEPAKRALERAAALSPNGDPVTVISTVGIHASGRRGGGSFTDERELARRRTELLDAKAALEAKGVQAQLVEGRGDPADTIVGQARDDGAELIVVGTGAKTAAKRFVLGSVSTKVLHDAPCDVLVVR